MAARSAVWKVTFSHQSRKQQQSHLRTGEDGAGPRQARGPPVWKEDPLPGTHVWVTSQD
jgi:hypothetical protein